MSRRKPKGVLRASGINDFRPGSDAVALIDGKAHVVSLDESYAPVPVYEPPAEVFRANAEKLTEEQRTVMLGCVLKTPFLSPEGRASRVRCLVDLGARLTFAVVPAPRRRVLRRGRMNIDVHPPPACYGRGMARDGKSNPFDGSGGSPGSHDAYQKANAPKGTPPGAPRSPEQVAPGGPLPFQPAPVRPGQTIGAGSPGQSLPVKLGG